MSVESPVRVLFVCTGNACRSQMAEGLARHLGGGRVQSYSAGVFPAGVNRFAIEVMKEAGIDISSHRSKSFEDLDGLEPDFVITLCDFAESMCPAYPGARRKEHWPTFDPSQVPGTREELLPMFRATRDELAARIREFLGETLPA